MNLKVDFDHALERVGAFGYAQQIHLSVFCLAHIFQAPLMLSLVFIGKTPSFTCLGRPVPENEVCQLDPPCKEFVYGKEFTSIVSEWDLVCDHKRDASYAQSLLMMGFLVGVVILGRVSDRIGRLKTYVWGMVAATAIQMLSGLAWNMYQYALSRFLVGFLVGGAGLAGHVLMVEGIVNRNRAAICTVYHCFFPIGLASFALAAYLVRDWRWLTFVSCLPMVTFVAVPLLVPESARWLASTGRVSEAEDMLLYFAERNGVKVSRSMISLVDKADETKGKESDGVMDLFRTPMLRRRMLIFLVTWFTCCMTFYGLSFEATKLAGNMYLNFALSTLFEIPAGIFSIYTLNRFGRRPTMSVSLFIVSLSCLSVMALPGSKDGQMARYQTYLAFIGKMGISVAFHSAYLFSLELLPTVLRNTGMGVCSMAARVGGIIAPTLPTFGSTFAYGVFGVCALLSGLLDLTLPESLNKQMPETVADVENSLMTSSLRVDGHSTPKT